MESSSPPPPLTTELERSEIYGYIRLRTCAVCVLSYNHSHPSAVNKWLDWACLATAFSYTMEDHSLAEAKKVQSLSKSPAELLPSATSLLPYRLNRRRTSLKLQLKRYFYLALPHVSLIIVSLAYTCLGAFVFMKLEEPHMRQLRKQMDLQVQTDKDQLLARLLELSRSRRSKEEGEVEFRNYVRSIYGMHKIKGLRERENLHYGDAPLGGGHPDRDRLLDPAEEWSFAAALFFVLTTLTTIGIFIWILILST